MMNNSAAAGFAAGVILMYLAAYVMMIPGRYRIRLLVNACLGAAALGAAHALGPVWGISLGINAVTALVSGFLGIPGVVLLTALGTVL